MRFIVDESTGPHVARWLEEGGHDVVSVFHDIRGITDDEVIERAYAEERILVTNDKDFGNKVYHRRHPHHCIILLRLADERTTTKISVLRTLLEKHAERLLGSFVVVTETRVRFASMAR